MHLKVVSRNSVKRDTPALDSPFHRAPVFDVTISAMDAEIPRVLGKGAKGELQPDGHTIKEVYTIKDALLMKDFAWLSDALTKQGMTTVRDTIFALFEYAKRVYSFDGVNLEFDSTKYGAVWAPTIDTFFVMDGLKTYAQQLLNGGVKKAAEIGGGSGMIGKYIMFIAKKLQELHIVDLDPDAVRCSIDNIHSEAVKRGVYDVEAMANGLEYVIKSGTKFDLVVSNPPYIPRPTGSEVNPFAGIELFTGLMDNCEFFLSEGGVLLLNVSSVADRERLMATRKATERGLIVHEVSELVVPFKVMPVQNDAEWMASLERSGKLHQEFHRGYDYWHKLNLIAVQKP